MTPTHPQPHQGFTEVYDADPQLEKNLAGSSLAYQPKAGGKEWYFVFEIWGVGRVPQNKKQQGPSFPSHLRRRKISKELTAKDIFKTWLLFQLFKGFFFFFGSSVFGKASSV